MARGLELKPDEPVIALNLARTEQTRGDYVSSARWAEHAVSLEPDNADALTQLGISLGYLEQFDDALPHFQKAYLLTPNKYTQIVNLGLNHAMMGATDSAYHYIVHALHLAPRDKQVDLYTLAVSSAIALGKSREARLHLECLRRIAPSAPRLAALSAELDAMSHR
jgi:Flp pilus assembly protein TadD